MAGWWGGGVMEWWGGGVAGWWGGGVVGWWGGGVVRVLDVSPGGQRFPL